MKDVDINSRLYWDIRFRTDWEKKGGREQTRFFCQITLEHLPEWIISDIEGNHLSIMDLGCAEGDAVEMLARRFPDSKIVGVDI